MPRRTKGKGKTVMKKALKIIVDILAWVVLIFAFVITLLVFTTEKNNGVPTLLGHMPMSVASDSMSPTFNKGDLIIDEKIDDLFKLKVDDVITFYTEIDGQRVLNTHRIVEINEGDNTRSFITRGDNNEADDKIPVGAADVVGKWKGVKIPKVGKALDFLRTKEGFFICILIPVAIFFLFELYKFISVLVEIRVKNLPKRTKKQSRKKLLKNIWHNRHNLKRVLKIQWMQ